MCRVQCTDVEGTTYVSTPRSINNVGQADNSKDCGYFSGYAVKVVHRLMESYAQHEAIIPGGAQQPRPHDARMSRGEVYTARNRLEGTTGMCFSTARWLGAHRAGAYMRQLGLGGYRQRRVTLVSGQQRFYLELFPNLLRDGNGRVHLGNSGCYWRGFVARKPHRCGPGVPTVVAGGHHLTYPDLFTPTPLGQLDRFLGQTLGAGFGIVCVRPTITATGAVTQGDPVDDETDGEWE